MALQECSLNLSQNLRELDPHGTPDFPCAGYRGIYTGREEDIIPWHWHEEIELIYVKKGSINVQIPNQLCHLNEGDGIFINSNILHLAQARPCCEIHSLVFHPLLISGGETTVFHQKYMEPLTHSSQLESYFFSCAKAWEKAAIDYMVQAFLAISSDAPGFEFTVREQLSGLCLTLFQNCQPLITKGPDTPGPDTLRLRRMLDFIHDHYTENIGLTQISQAAGLSARECLRCFKRTIQVSPIQYLLRHRISHAAALLSDDPQERVADVATKCGFESPSNFSQLFKRYLKCSPRAFQKKQVISSQNYADGLPGSSSQIRSGAGLHTER